MDRFPFEITPEIQRTWSAWQHYLSAGSAWLREWDPDGFEEADLLDEICLALQSAAQAHCGPEFELVVDEFELDNPYGNQWRDILDAKLDTEVV